jgi:hypothetical protein
LKGLNDVRIHTKKGQVYLNDEKWDGEKVYIDYNNGIKFINLRK